MTRFRFYIVVLFLCFISCDGEQSNAILLKQPTIINVTNGDLSTNSILIENGVIKEIGGYQDLKRQNPLLELDCRNKYVIPGLFDMHMHIAEEHNMTPDLYRLLERGVTGIRDMGGIADTVAQAKNRINKGEIQGPDIYFTGVTLDGAQSNDPFHYKVYDTTSVKSLALDLKKLGVDFFKVHNYFPIEKLGELKEIGDSLELKITGHIPVGVGLWELDSVGIKSVEHVNSLLSGIVLKQGNNVNTLEDAFIALDSTYISQLSSHFVENDIALTPTLFAMYDMYSNLENPSSRETGLRLLDLFYNVTKWMNQNNVLLLAGTDRGKLDESNINELHDELAIMVKSGLSPLDALKTATINPAKFLEIDTHYGSIEVNKKANLIILNSNPLMDISNIMDIHNVLKNGEVLN